MTRSLVWGTALIIILAAATLAGRAVDRAPTRPVKAAADGLGGELARCRAAGQAALGDPSCRRAWDGERARFFGSRPS